MAIAAISNIDHKKMALSDLQDELERGLDIVMYFFLWVVLVQHKKIYITITSTI
jgi:hypothetical protein